MLRFLTAGESHGPVETAIIDGIPAGLEITEEEIQSELDRRKMGTGRGGRGFIEKDKVNILSGVRYGITLGSPITLSVNNMDFDNNLKIMTNKSVDLESMKKSRLTKPRPGHADLAGVLKYGFTDIRNVSERASARETVMRVALGAVAKKLLSELHIKVASHTIQIGNITVNSNNYNFEKILTIDSIDPDIRCLNPDFSVKMKKAILEAIKQKDTLGGVIEIITRNVPPGIGSHVHWDRKLDSKLAQSLMSIPSVKTVEIGNGLQSSHLPGSKVHDEILFDNNRYFRKTNNNGGIEGGISNGEDIVCKIYLKPISTLGNPLNSVDIITKKKVQADIQRSDICVVPRAGVIGEACVALILAELCLEKFGGDTIREFKVNYRNYITNISDHVSSV
ncbi:chorismate synthase [Candidatus Gottesmanbacteria bacterium CG11_big_fil_rev_8_21_14_0_20_37_11]|uniref:Chorismate synthase n=3 Tax=Candidatus Gottesmaniibacteriota TaxID=1752720 RepID=A0A2M7RPU2_9BACT|nr:MAG: chorismate synthase [Candidatus Gottesmanbacteria bacterium CG1_02_37_22]PIP32280.1 MAG: chorismate synthase [Candidatus Gottesmanbacteria bacterium CG23_combo_of_CG06-09_8_20_14_all_37_19]PIR08848.1 MAG: chorismate synthase [Candidatus Gottesmanbacteria bacterium CG11_big_fil_rev_8_21_14_0_20_37_11]PIZ02346.1 MAG: chorismate synthase [Candidatus Gottesmanbacteria bacterium CG_4_10_14_0_8_um_filter_37_24]